MKHIHNVTSFLLFKDNLYLIDSKGNLIFKNNKILKVEPYSDLFYVYDTLIIRSSLNGQIISVHPNSPFEYEHKLKNVSNNFLYYYKGKISERVYGVSKINNDLSTHDLFETKEFNILLLFNELVFGTNNYILYCTNYITNTPLWQLPLSELGSDPYDANASDAVKEILGLVGNNLWFYSRCGRLVAVDVESGKIIFMLSGNNKENNIKYQRTKGLGDVYFRESDKCIICISSYYFQVIDTVKNDIKEIYNFRENDQLGIGKYSSIYSPLLQGDYFTFLAEKDEDYGGTRRVGIFDYKARKLVWEHEVFTQEEVNQTKVKLLHPRPLKMSEDTKKLYILDSADTLHIFEREV